MLFRYHLLHNNSLVKFAITLKMKTAFCLLVLSAVVAVQSATVNTSTRANLNIGAIYPGDRLLISHTLYSAPVANMIQSQGFIYRPSANTSINGIFAREVGVTQFANIWLVAGGLNQSNVTLRAESQRGRGFYYAIEIWGR